MNSAFGLNAKDSFGCLIDTDCAVPGGAGTCGRRVVAVLPVVKSERPVSNEPEMARA